jgi:hypothetical protein
MRPLILPILAALSLLAGCGLLPSEPRVRDPVSISFYHGACYGFCPDYSATVFADGRGLFEGRGHVVARGRHAFAFSPAQFRALAAAVAPLKPERGSIPRIAECNIMDGSSMTLVWTGADGASQSVCLGSHDEFPDRAEAMRIMAEARDMLPLRGLSDPVPPQRGR